MLLPTIFERNFLNNFFDTPFFDDRDIRKLEAKMYGHRGKNIMKTDICEDDNAYEMCIDLPGFSKDEIKVSVDDGYLTVCAEKNTEKDDTGKYLRKERCFGKCERSFYIGKDVKEEQISAEFKHGVLKLTLPKSEKKALSDKNYIAIE